MLIIQRFLVYLPLNYFFKVTLYCGLPLFTPKIKIEAEKRNLKVEDQVRINVYFDGKKVGVYVPDKIVNDTVLVEVKCKPFLTQEDKRQFWLYLKGSKYKLGLLINFGPKKLEIERRVYDKARLPK